MNFVNFCGPNTSRPKFLNDPRPKCVDFSYKKYIKWEYSDILAQKT